MSSCGPLPTALLTGHLTLSRAVLEHLASSLNSLRSASAFSRAIIFVLHLLQICVGSPPSIQAVTWSKLSILLAHDCCCKPVAVKKLVALTLVTKPLQSLHTHVLVLEAIAMMQREGEIA